MPGQFPTSMGSIAAVATLLACVGIPTTIARAADCLTAPYFSAPEGSQWYYQTDRATKRKCWFLRAKNQSTQQPAAQAESEAAPATRTTAFEQPATASIGVRNSAASQTSAQPAGPAAGVGAGVPTTIARADDCLTAPNSPAPAGRRWSYRTDRATQRKCWYVRAADERTQHTDARHHQQWHRPKRHVHWKMRLPRPAPRCQKARLRALGPCRPSSPNQWAARRRRTLSTKALRRKILRHQVGSDPRRRPLRRLHRRPPLGHPISPRLLRPVWRNPMPLRAMPALTPSDRLWTLGRATMQRARLGAARPPPAPPGRRSL